MSDPHTSTVQWAWQQQSIWSQTADKLKTGPTRARTASLSLAITVAVLGLLSAQLTVVAKTAGVVIGAVATAVAGLLAVVQSQRTSQQLSNWTRARSVAEAIKTDVYLYLATPTKDPDHEQRLDADVQRVIADAVTLSAETAGVAAKERPLPAVDDLDTYLQVRVLDGQVTDYYEKKLGQRIRQLAWAQRAQVALAIVAAVLTALAAVSANIPAWAAVAATVATAVAAHAAASRWDYERIEYARTAQELRRLAARRTAADGTALTDEGLVAACENIISIQNQGWMAKWTTPE